MNLPNKLTLLRVFLIPIFIIFLSFPIPHGALIALIIFLIASITDHFDGKIAREQNLISNFGIFMDPFADKLLVTSAIIVLVSMGYVPAWIAIVIIAREFAVSGLRTVAANEGTVIAASNLGKIKTALQMIAIISLLLKLALLTDSSFNGVMSIEIIKQFFNYVPTILIYLAAIMTLVSGIDYFVKGWKNIDPNK